MNAPREPRNSVGRAAASRGPSEAMNTSAASAARSRSTQRAQARRSGFLAGLDQPLHVEAQPAARGQHPAQRREVDAVLALVVRGAAAVPAVALHGQRPRREARAPLRVVAQHDVAVAVHEDRGQRVVFVTRRQCRNGPAPATELSTMRKRKPMRGKRRPDFVRQVAAKLGERIRRAGSRCDARPAAAGRRADGRRRTTLARRLWHLAGSTCPRCYSNRSAVHAVRAVAQDARSPCSDATSTPRRRSFRAGAAAARLPGTACRDTCPRRVRRRGCGAFPRCAT